MLKKLRKSSGRVTLVLIGVAALSACGNDEERRRDVYATRDDCLADWSNKPEDCTPATESHHAAGGYWYGPVYGYHGGAGGSDWTRGARQGSRAIASSTSGVSRGGFGSSGHSSGG
jgi:uncharacterized protein YgiB involved in biofilm formation